MALFDSIITETGERFDLSGDQSKALLASMLGLMNDSKNGGFRGFSSRFSNANLTDTFSSWTTTGENAPISQEQIESALGAETIAAVADRAGLDYATTVSAMAFLLPQTIERLTPDGSIPDEQNLSAAIADFNDESAATVTEANSSASAVSTGAFDRIGNATEDIGGKEHDMMSENRISDFAAVGDRFSGAPAASSDSRLAENLDEEFNDDSPLKWLVPLIITALLIALGFWFCGGKSAQHASINSVFHLIKIFTV